jgi:malate dehydrogenase (oxaloacetate-decarboxylating)
MISIGVITRGKYGLRLIENIRNNSNFKVSSLELPESLPDFIEEPAEFVKGLDLDRSFFSNDLIITYIIHPDLTPEIARIAGENGAHAVIIAGGAAKAGGRDELLDISKKYGIHIEIHEICCDIGRSSNKTVMDFGSCFGRPQIRITTKDGIISDILVIRGAPCGSTWHMAKNLIGSKTEDAPAKGGLLVQQYPCRAIRGSKGGIHKAAKLHKEAVEKALKESGQMKGSIYERSLKFHEAHQGKIALKSKISLKTKDDLSLAYTPGVAEACLRIQSNKDDIYRYTSKGNLVAVVSDGTSVLGLGDLGGYAALPVMEGKAALFKVFAGVDAFPICLDTRDTEEVINIVKNIAPVFGGINLEDIAAPRCFEIETRLKGLLDIPVFHDDQHGAALVMLAGLINALKVVGKKFGQIKVVISGAGAAATASAKLLIDQGVRDIIICDSTGIIYEGRAGLNPYKEGLARLTNKNQVTGNLADAMKGADVFIGLSVGGIVSEEMIRSMSYDAIALPLANPTPEIMPEKAKKAGARIVGSGRSDCPNQINNAIGFPGIFRGALDVRARDINEVMKMAAANALASLVPEPSEEQIIPSIFDTQVAPAVASAVARAAMESGVARKRVSPEEVARHTRELVRIQ